MRILRMDEVANLTGLSHSSVYKQIRLGKFPKGSKITARATGWSETDIEAWIQERFEQHEDQTHVA